ncbi:MAG: BON domain-containing protein, partial [Terriglobales bacterium]
MQGLGRIAASAALAAVLASAAAPSPGSRPEVPKPVQAPQTQARSSLRTTVLQTLINDPELGRFPLAASVAPDFTVQLDGALPSKQDRATAERLVKSIAGVKGVHNRIAVNPQIAALYPA